MSTVLNGFDDGLWSDGVWEPLGAESGGMNLNHWADAAWAYDSWVAESWGGLGLSEEGIGLAPVAKPVDFVLDVVPRQRNVIDFSKWRVVKQEKTELQEMIELYSRWKAA